MKIVVDENIPLAGAFFGELGELIPCAGRTLSPAQLRDADVLLVRSVTPVDRTLLEGSRVGFVASATIGTDHIDRDWLAAAGIGFANAPGCNAHSVVDYVLAALLHLAEGDWDRLAERRIGVVGAGNVGGRLVERLAQMGLPCRVCDPPRGEREDGIFYTVDEVIEQCDLICLHTPLVTDGPHPSHHLFTAERLARLAPDCWLLNAGRGPVIDNRALVELLPQRPDLRVVLDVWEPEPAVNPELVPLVAIATPHIAGYSDEGRSRGTEMIYQALCHHLGIAAEKQLQMLLPEGPVLALSGTANPVAAAVRGCYDINLDDRAFRQMVSAGQLPGGFDRLRKHYPGRREFASCRVRGVDPASVAGQQLQALGFTLVA